MKNDFEDYLAECLKNPEFKKHWEEQLAELEKERERIRIFNIRCRDVDLDERKRCRDK